MIALGAELQARDDVVRRVLDRQGDGHGDGHGGGLRQTGQFDLASLLTLVPARPPHPDRAGAATAHSADRSSVIDRRPARRRRWCLPGPTLPQLDGLDVLGVRPGAACAGAVDPHRQSTGLATDEQVVLKSHGRLRDIAEYPVALRRAGRTRRARRKPPYNGTLELEGRRRGRPSHARQSNPAVPTRCLPVQRTQGTAAQPLRRSICTRTWQHSLDEPEEKVLPARCGRIDACHVTIQGAHAEAQRTGSRLPARYVDAPLTRTPAVMRSCA